MVRNVVNVKSCYIIGQTKLYIKKYCDPLSIMNPKFLIFQKVIFENYERQPHRLEKEVVYMCEEKKLKITPILINVKDLWQ
jgi:hypothetical protein